MTSEHHGGFAGYMAQPLQMASFVLAEHATGWAAAAPLLLPLRSTALVAEEVAWLQARHPGRVGLGVAAGALPLDFEAAGVNQADSSIASNRNSRDWSRCSAARTWAARRRPGAPRLPARSGSGPQRSRVGCRRRSSRPVWRRDPYGRNVATSRLARLTRAFDEAGGEGSKVLIRRVWLGRLPSGLIEGQRAVYESYAATSSFGEDQTIATDEPEEMVERLAATMREVGADALNLRVQLPGMTPEHVREQIEQIGSTVVQPLKKIWPSTRREPRSYRIGVQPLESGSHRRRPG